MAGKYVIIIIITIIIIIITEFCKAPTLRLKELSKYKTQTSRRKMLSAINNKNNNNNS